MIAINTKKTEQLGQVTELKIFFSRHLISPSSWQEFQWKLTRTLLSLFRYSECFPTYSLMMQNLACRQRDAPPHDPDHWYLHPACPGSFPSQFCCPAYQHQRHTTRQKSLSSSRPHLRWHSADHCGWPALLCSFKEYKWEIWGSKVCSWSFLHRPPLPSRLHQSPKDGCNWQVGSYLYNHYSHRDVFAGSTDLEFFDDIEELFDQFELMSSQAVIAIGRDLSPHYRSLLSKFVLISKICLFSQFPKASLCNTATV